MDTSGRHKQEDSLFEEMLQVYTAIVSEPAHDKTYNKTCATSEDSRSACASTQSDQSLH